MLYHKNLLAEQWADIHVKLAIIFWGVVYYLNPPNGIVRELGTGLITASALLAILGSIIGIVGLILSNSKEITRRFQGTIIEFSGLIMAASGPFAYFITVAYLTIRLNNPQGFSFAAISYALCAALISRILLVRRGFKEAG